METISLSRLTWKYAFQRSPSLSFLFLRKPNTTHSICLLSWPLLTIFLKNPTNRGQASHRSGVCETHCSLQLPLRFLVQGPEVYAQQRIYVAYTESSWVHFSSGSRLLIPSLLFTFPNIISSFSVSTIVKALSAWSPLPSSNYGCAEPSPQPQGKPRSQPRARHNLVSDCGNYRERRIETI